MLKYYLFIRVELLGKYISVWENRHYICKIIHIYVFVGIVYELIVIVGMLILKHKKVTIHINLIKHIQT